MQTSLHGQASIEMGDRLSFDRIEASPSNTRDTCGFLSEITLRNIKTLLVVVASLLSLYIINRLFFNLQQYVIVHSRNKIIEQSFYGPIRAKDKSSYEHVRNYIVMYYD